MTFYYLFEALAALSVVCINMGFLCLGESLTQRRSETESITFLLKWNAFRVLCLVIVLSAILFYGEVDQMKFTLFFIGFYFCTIFYRLYRYGTAVR